MIRTPKATMTMRELDRLKCIQVHIDGHLKQHVVATRLGLTARQVRRGWSADTSTMVPFDRARGSVIDPISI